MKQRFPDPRVVAERKALAARPPASLERVLERQRNQPANPMPIHALGGDKDNEWETFTAEGQLSKAKATTRLCSFDPVLFSCLQNPAFRLKVRETLVTLYFTPKERVMLCARLGLPVPKTEWLEALGSLLTRCPPSRWKDRDELVFRERINALAQQFERVLATCFLRDGALPETAVRVAVTPRSGIERNLVVSLTPEQTRETERLLSELRKHLPKNKSQISLAALSRLIWDLIPKEE